MRTRKRSKWVVYLVLAATLSMPIYLFAQHNKSLMGGGILMVDEEMTQQQQQPTQRGLMNRTSASPQHQGTMGNQTFGLDLSENYTPLGSGIILLMAAGAGYALFKSKKSKK